MPRRAATLVATFAIASFLSPLPAHAADPPTAFTIDGVGPFLSDVVVASNASVQTYGIPGSLRFYAGPRDVTVAPPTGGAFVAGQSFAVGGTQTASQGYIDLFTQCGQVTGTVTVDAVTFDGTGAVKSLAASYDTTCSGGSYAGILRKASDVPYVATYPTATPMRTGVGTPTPGTITVTNFGTAPTTLGAAAIGGTNAAEFAVTADGCDGVTLAKDQHCDIAVTFDPAALGVRRATLTMPASGHPRPAGIVWRFSGTAYAPPPAPTGLGSFETYNGVGLQWAAVTTEPPSTTGYAVYRRPDAGSAWTKVATPTTTSWEDTGLAPGESAQYAVTTVGYGGESPLSAAIDVTRPVTEPGGGSTRALVVDNAEGTLPSVAATGAELQVWESLSGVTTYRAADGTMLFLPVLRPGTYAKSLFEIVSGVGCWLSGTLSVTEAVYAPNMTPAVYAASFTGTCSDYPSVPVTFQIRWYSARPYVRVTATPGQVSAAKKVGVAVDRTVTIASLGTGSATIGTPTIDGPAAADWTVLPATTCGGTLAGGASCDVALRFTPSAPGAREAVLHVPDGTPLGERAIRLHGVGGAVPGAVPNVRTTGTLAGIGVFWGAAADNGLPVSAYRVYRATGGGAPELLDTVGGDARSYVDRAVTTGVTYQYSVEAVNDGGTGPILTTVAGSRGRSQLVVTWLGGAAIDRGLYVTAPDGGDHVPLEVDGHDHVTPAVSPDGKWVVYARDGDDGYYDLWVRATDGTGSARQLTTAAGDEVEPAWSPDGTRIAYGAIDLNDNSTVREIPAAGGLSTYRAGEAGEPSWLPDSASLVATDFTSDAAPLTLIGPTGARTAIAGTAYGMAPHVSPDGTRVAFERYDPPGLRIGVTPVGGSASPTFLTPSNDVYVGTTWRPDGAAIVTRDQYLDLASASYPGGTVSPAAVPTDVDEVAYDTLGVVITSRPAVTKGSVSLAFGVPGAPAGTTYTCSRDGLAPVACTSPWTATGLTTGRHSLVVRAGVPGAVTSVAAHQWTVDATPPTTSVALLPGVVLGSATTVRWSGADAGSHVASYDVRYRRASGSEPFGAFAYPSWWQHTTAGSGSLSLGQGYEYCVSARSRDVAGNVGAWSAERCTTRPYDDRALSGSTGWTRGASPSYYLGTYTVTGRAGLSLTRASVTARRLTLLATRCPTCGSVAVYLGSTYLGTVNLYAATTQRQVAIALPLQPVARSGTLTLRSTSAKPVYLDGVALRRT